MAEYYEAETLLEFVKQNTPHIDGETTMKCVERAIRNAPTADVVEVKHGEWIVAEECKTPLSHGYIRTEKTYICPFCHYHFRKKMKHCGECGAKMDGGKNDA